MGKNQMSVAGWFASQIAFVVNSFYVFGIAPVILYRNGIIPLSELILASYWVTAVTSLVVIVLTLIRWLIKYPSRLTWLQSAFGFAAIASLTFCYATLNRFYSNEMETPSDTAAILSSAAGLVITFVVTYLAIRAMKNKFKN